MTSAPPKVLVVEDDQGVARMLRFSLRDAGFEVVVAKTGGEALKVLAEPGIKAVILDLGLPDGLGGAVLGLLRERDRQQDGHLLPWVVITAQDRDEVMKRYGSLGDRLIPKPFDPWDLVRSLQRRISES